MNSEHTSSAATRSRLLHGAGRGLRGPRVLVLSLAAVALAFGSGLSASASASHSVDARASANLDAAAAAPSKRTRLFKRKKQVTYESLTCVEKGRVDTALDYADKNSRVEDWDCSIHSGGVYCEDELGSCWCDWDITPPSCGCSD